MHSEFEVQNSNGKGYMKLHYRTKGYVNWNVIRKATVICQSRIVWLWTILWSQLIDRRIVDLQTLLLSNISYYTDNKTEI
jgi:hypothetical protein